MQGFERALVISINRTASAADNSSNLLSTVRELESIFYNTNSILDNPPQFVFEEYGGLTSLAD